MLIFRYNQMRMLVKQIKFLILLALFSCAGITPLNSSSWRNYYSKEFLSLVEEVASFREKDNWDSAIELLMSVDEETLTLNERAFRRNLIGVHFLQNKNFEKSLKAASGVFLGLIVSGFTKALISIVFLVIYINLFLNNFSNLF